MVTVPALAGGGGQDVILVVNPNHEGSLRIANAYARVRNIPANNIVFDITGPPLGLFTDTLAISKEQVKSIYIDPLASIISQRGLDHADYIGTLGQSALFKTGSGNAFTASASLTHALSLLTPISQGTVTPEGTAFLWSSMYQGNVGATPNNTAIHHAVAQNGPLGATQTYMAGAVGFTGFFGNTPAQSIAGLERAAAGDGAKPQGTVYFEENDDIRSNTREWQWPSVQADLTARGVNWIEESNTSGASPQNRSDVRGAVIGAANPVVPNGSTYLPGSWVDSLTSSSGNFSSIAHTKVTTFIANGAGASSGAISEPFALTDRFPHANIHTQIADGSTLGEAFFKSVRIPDFQQFVGDLLAQPYADVPTVSVTGVADGQTVTGQIQVSAAASLTNPTVATGIKQLEIYIDGKPSDTPITAANGTFTIDTTLLSDGQHELRIVAINNALAESEAADIRTLHVNNHNRSISTLSSLTLDATQVAPVAITTSAGDGAVSRIELRQLGRVLGSTNAANGNINLDAAALAYGDNPVVPVAIYTDGSEVAGTAISVHRNTPALIAGQTPAPAGNRTPGASVELFDGQGALTIATSDYTGTPDHAFQASEIKIQSGLATRLGPSAISMDLTAQR